MDQKQRLSEDHEILALLLARYEPNLRKTHDLVADRLSACGVTSPAPRDLVFRHGVGFYAFLDALGGSADGAERVVSGAILAYSLPLVMIDIQLDGHAGELRTREPLWREIGDDSGLSMIVHSGYAALAEEFGGTEAVALVARTSADVIAAMRRDRRRDRDPVQLDVTPRSLHEYWESPSSRLKGSGLPTVMAGLADLLASGEIDPEHSRIGSDLGLLRQVQDELMDVSEDVAAGLITLPVAYALRDPEKGPRLKRYIRFLWSANHPASLSSREDHHLRELVLSAGGHLPISSRANALMLDLLTRMTQHFSRPEPLHLLVRQRRALMDRAVDDGLRDANPLGVDVLLDRTSGVLGP